MPLLSTDYMLTAAKLIVLALVIGCGDSGSQLENAEDAGVQSLLGDTLPLPADVPTYAEASPLTEEANVEAFQIANALALRDSAFLEHLNVHRARAFTLPQSTTWADVEAFYDQQLSAAAWQTEPDMKGAEVAEDGSFMAWKVWTRQDSGREEILSTYYVNEPEFGISVLLLVYQEPKVELGQEIQE